MGFFSDILGGIGDIFGNAEAGGDRQQALNYLNSAQSGFQGINPNIQAQQAANGYASIDPTDRATQLDAIAQLRNQISQGGLDAISKANLAQVQNANAQAARGQQAGIMQAAAQRGAANSGNTLLAQEVAGQNAANQGANAGLQIAGQQQQSRQQAVGQLGQMGQALTSEDYNRANALNQINEFNASQRQNAEGQTVNNRLNQAGGAANVYGQQAAQLNNDGQKVQQLWGGVGKAVGALGDGAASALSGGAADGASFG